MGTETVFSVTRPWFAADGTEDGKPCIFRGRQISNEFIGDPSLPYAFIVTHAFDVTDRTGLPERAQYKVIEEFERDYLDSIEARELGIVAFVKTCDGVVRYFLYVSSVEAVANMFASVNASRFRVELAAGEDLNWSEYRAFLRGMRCGANESGQGGNKPGK